MERMRKKGRRERERGKQEPRKLWLLVELSFITGSMQVVILQSCFKDNLEQ